VYPKEPGTVYPKEPGTVYPKEQGTVYPKEQGTVYPKEQGIGVSQDMRQARPNVIGHTYRKIMGHVGLRERSYALTMQATGQASAHCGDAKWPSHSTQVVASITYRMPSPSVIDWVGHSGRQAPQAIQSSIIFIAIVILSIKR